jgi:nicotinamidase-related amidase
MPVHELSLGSSATLVVIDVQNAIDDLKWGPRNNLDAEDQIASLLAAWRGVKWPIVHIRHDSTDPTSPYRPGQVGNDSSQQSLRFDEDEQFRTLSLKTSRRLGFGERTVKVPGSAFIVLRGAVVLEPPVESLEELLGQQRYS